MFEASASETQSLIYKICWWIKNPYGYCEKHKESHNRWVGCGSCFVEYARKARAERLAEEREEKIELIKEAIIRASKEV